MAGTILSSSEDKTQGVYSNLDYPKILEIAEIHGLEKTPIWHARVAQALLHNLAYSAALEQFQISLDKHNATPILSEQAIAVIHRDMARSCTEVGKYKEALEHSRMAELLHAKDYSFIGSKVGRLLNLAQVEYFAKMTDKAIATVDEAWEVYVGQEEEYSDYHSYTAFFFFFELLRASSDVSYSTCL